MTARQILALLGALFLSPTSGWAEDYEYPAKVEAAVSCQLDKQKLAVLKVNFSYGLELSRQTTADVVDLNGDGVCEVFLTTLDVYAGAKSIQTRLLLLHNGEYLSSPPAPWKYPNWWYGEPRNGYLQIYVSDYWHYGYRGSDVTEVYYHDGEGYVKDAGSGSTHGELEQLGKQAYLREDYATAARHYLNAYRAWNENELSDANNLALAWIGLGKTKEAETLLMERIAGRKQKPAHLIPPNNDVATAHFHLGLIAEARDNLDVAFEYYVRSFMEHRTEAKREKLNEIKTQLGVEPKRGHFKCVDENGKTTYTESNFGCTKAEKIAVQSAPKVPPIQPKQVSEQLVTAPVEKLITGTRRRGLVKIDGVMGRDEWRGVEPLAMTLSDGGKDELNLSIYVMNDDDWLYTAFQYPLPKAAKSLRTISLMFYPDFYTGSVGRRGLFRDYQRLSYHSVVGSNYYDGVTGPKYGCSAKGTCSFPDVQARGTNDGEGAHTTKKNVVTIEFKKPLRSRDTNNDMQVTLGSDLGITVKLENFMEMNEINSYNVPETDDPELVIVRLLGR